MFISSILGKATLFVSISVIAAFPALAQVSGLREKDATIRRIELTANLQVLEASAKRLDKPLARAQAEAEIADAAWATETEWAKALLREAYELTLPDEEDQANMRRLPVGEQPRLPNSLDRARWTVRSRVQQVAARDKNFITELINLCKARLGTYEAHLQAASFAKSALSGGDKDAAKDYILQAIDADPTQLGVLSAIEQLAAKDRAAADTIILQYIQRLGAMPLSLRDGSFLRTILGLTTLIHPSEGQNVSPPGPAVMREYVSYTLNRVSSLELQYPGSITASRTLLLHTYPLLRQYAPELTQQFLDLEQRSRKPGEDFSLSTAKGLDEEYKAKYEKQVERELESDQPDALVIQKMVSRGDFSKARKMIDKLADGPQKIELLEILNTQQALSLVNKGDIPGAQKLAESLVKAASILRVLPMIAGKCAAKNDDECARYAVNQAVEQLKKADLTPFAPPPGVPASIMGTSKDFDPVLNSLGSLASAVISLKDELALDVLDELVIAANHSELDTGLGRTGFETSLFKKLAEKNEARVNLAAMQFKDPLRQIVALAAIEQWKSDKLAAEAKLRSVENESTNKKN